MLDTALLLKKLEEMEAHLEKRLEEDQRDLGMAGESDSGLVQFNPNHLADTALDLEERQRLLSDLYSTREALREIRRAKERALKHPERVGRCEKCGNPIEPKRLEIEPWALFCVSCERQREKSRSER